MGSIAIGGTPGLCPFTTPLPTRPRRSATIFSTARCRMSHSPVEDQAATRDRTRGIDIKKLRTETEALAAARRFADEIRAEASQRDRERRLPFDELQSLR